RARDVVVADTVSGDAVLGAVQVDADRVLLDQVAADVDAADRLRDGDACVVRRVLDGEAGDRDVVGRDAEARCAGGAVDDRVLGRIGAERAVEAALAAIAVGRAAKLQLRLVDGRRGVRARADENRVAGRGRR